ncbi:MAG: argonaute/piwi family protein, partial [Candidatus Hodarchaeales archaeon]
SSNYYNDELEGFKKGTEQIEKRDFITIMNTPVRFFREGKYPVVRGTLISSSKDHYFFTTGYNPTLETYFGKGIPDPLLIRPFINDSPIDKICDEIMVLTRLDWNNIYFNTRLPVTLSIAGKVGEILSEPRAKDLAKPLTHYRFYM